MGCRVKRTELLILADILPYFGPDPKIRVVGRAHSVTVGPGESPSTFKSIEHLARCSGSLDGFGFYIELRGHGSRCSVFEFIFELWGYRFCPTAVIRF